MSYCEVTVRTSCANNKLLRPAHMLDAHPTDRNSFCTDPPRRQVLMPQRPTLLWAIRTIWLLLFGLSLLAELGASLGRSWFLVGPSWVHLRWSAVDCGPTWACLGSSCGDVEYPWGFPGLSDAILKLSWAIPILLRSICTELGDLWYPKSLFSCDT